LTVPPPVERPPAGEALYKTILCAVDFGPSAIRALEYALSLAREADARLILLHVLESFADVSYLGDTASFPVPDYHRLLERESLKQLRALLPADVGSWCRPEELVVSGKAYREILRVARDADAELIVLGVQGRGALDLLLFGSTTHHVIRAADCPVLTLRAP
jgi:nucleotide-binding universal stress UspA family protein